MLQASQIDPRKSMYEIPNGPDDWNCYPLAPLGCKAVVYEDGDTKGLWESRGIDEWYLGPSLDHYRCNIYYVTETQGYRISAQPSCFRNTVNCQVCLPTSTYAHLPTNSPMGPQQPIQLPRVNGCYACSAIKLRQCLHLLCQRENKWWWITVTYKPENQDKEW